METLKTCIIAIKSSFREHMSCILAEFIPEDEERTGKPPTYQNRVRLMLNRVMIIIVIIIVIAAIIITTFICLHFFVVLSK